MRLSLNNTQKLVFYSSLGGLLEFYDFVIYALLASFISEHFFATSDKTIALLETFATFAVGYLVRPIGGIVFGHFGDKHGRKRSFVLSIFIMAASTFLMGCIPSYHHIGFFAPVLLLFLRICQGFSVGGEIPGSITYISEVSPSKEGLYTSILFTGLIPGIVLGSLVIEVLYLFFSQTQVNLWAWRIPFLLGGLLGIVNYLLRKKFHESPVFNQIKNHLHPVPSLVVLKSHFRSLFSAACFVANLATIIILLFLFIPAYLNKMLHYSTSQISVYSSVFLLLGALLCPVFGALADRIDKVKLLRALTLLSLIFAIPIFYCYINHIDLWLPFTLSAILLGFTAGITPATLAELFPTDVRYSGVGMAYNLAFAIFGGLTPVFAMLLIHISGQLISPAYLLLFSSLLSLFGSMLLSRTPAVVRVAA